MAGVTRSNLSQQSPLFDNICDLKGSQLPTYQDIIKCFFVAAMATQTRVEK